ncbi:MAG: hypothetical protein NZ519_06690 [Bacteroidia bacterium]|nr:hypothetical protein [Bacteroidia bacterium]
MPVRAVRSVAKYRSEAQCGMPRPLRSKGHAQKTNFSKIKFTTIPDNSWHTFRNAAF